MAAIGKGQYSRVLVWGILILVLVGLTGYGVRNFGGGVNFVGQVGDTKIDVNRYARTLERELRAISQQTGQNMTLAQAQQFGIDAQVLQLLIGQVALENEAARLGLSVGDEEVRRQVLETPAFQGPDGKFDKEAYKFTLQQNGLTVKTFEQTLRTDTARRILEGAVSSGIAAPPEFADAIVAFLGETRSFSWLKLERSDLQQPVPSPSEDELKAYYEDNIADFTIPETRKITYAALSPDDLIATIPVDEAALRKLYEDRSDEFNRPERRVVDRLVFPTAEEASAAIDAIATGQKTFEDLVTERGLKMSDVNLGEVTRSDLGKAADAVFSLEKPGVAGPVETELGPAIFQVNAIVKAQTTPFEQVIDQLKAQYSADKARTMIADMVSDLEDLLASGATLEELAKETDMKLGTIDWQAGMTDGIAADPAFRDAAATVTKDDFPTITDLTNGGIFALRLDDIVPAHPEPFDQAREKVAAAWEAAKVLEMLTEQANALKEKVDSGTRLSALGYPVTVETRLTRDASIDGTPNDFVAKVFDLPQGGTVVEAGTDAVFIAHLDAIEPADMRTAEAEALRARISRSLAQGLAQDALSMFTTAMRDKAGFSLNQAAISAVHAQFPQ